MTLSRRMLGGAALFAAAAFVAAGCTAGPTGSGPGKTSKAAHQHPEEGPHGGALAEWGAEEYHAEFTVDHDKKQATVYILDETAAKAAPIKAESITLTVTTFTPPVQITLKADPQQGDPKGSASRYTGTHDKLATVTEFKGEFAGAPFQGRGLTGYDPHQKKYRGVWVDSMSPTIYTTEGSFDDAGKVYSETMEGLHPDGKPAKMRMTTEVKGKDQMVFKMYARGEDGKENQMMEIAYTRKK